MDGDDRPHSHHHRRHRRHRRFEAESEDLARHRQDMRLLLWILPSCMLGLGLFLLYSVLQEPEPARRPQGILDVSYVLLGAAVLWFAALFVGKWVAAVREERRERDRERGVHRHHRHADGDGDPEA